VANRKTYNFVGKTLLAPCERICKQRGGRLESKGIRRETRRYRCVQCKSNAGSIPISQEEQKFLRSQDKGIGNLM
jgi:putative hemolysin